LSVFENVELGALGGGLRRGEARALTWELLQDSHLEGRAAERAESLPHGEERRVGILRAVAMRPRFLLLDEPAAGLNEAEAGELVDFLAQLPGRFDLGLLVIEHNMPVIMRLCKRIHVINYGKTIAIGTPEQVRKDPAVVSAYLGT
jgi:branched-chain amino acid transport system ATP-binding protein